MASLRRAQVGFIEHGHGGYHAADCSEARRCTRDDNGQIAGPRGGQMDTPGTERKGRDRKSAEVTQGAMNNSEEK
jgi:hypothetical protein